MPAALSKRQKALIGIIDPKKAYPLPEAMELVVKAATAKFDESVEMHFSLDIDPKQSDQQVRSVAALPHGTGRTKRVAVVAKGEKQKEATQAGADMVGDIDLVEKISKGWLEFDVLIATPDMMKDLAKLGKILGPKGLMPNPKTETVTFDIAKAVKEVKAGRVEFRADPQGNVHAAIGKVSFGAQKLLENAQTFWGAILAAKPSGAKGAYLLSVSVASTMGPGIRVVITQQVQPD